MSSATGSSTAEPTAHDRPTRLVLVRHGESLVTVDRVIGGVRTCRGLSPLGHQQAERLATRWRASSEFSADVLIASDFPRAIETAMYLADALGIAETHVEQHPEFGEHDPGPDIDGMTFDAYVERYGAPEWDGDPHVDIFPGGETTARFHTRVYRGLDGLIDERRGSTVVISCHGGVIDATVRHLVGLAMTGGVELQALNTSITEFESTQRGVWRLVRYNDAAHLAGLPERTPRAEVRG